MFKKIKPKTYFPKTSSIKNPKDKLPFAVIVWLQDGPQ